LSSTAILRGVGKRAPVSQKEIAASEQPTASESQACLPAMLKRSWRR
jgi:hypothetical protein